MTLEFVVVVVVVGNLFSGVCGFLAGRSFGQLSLNLDDAQRKADEARKILEGAKEKAEKEKSAVESAARSETPESDLAALINEGRKE